MSISLSSAKRQRSMSRSEEITTQLSFKRQRVLSPSAAATTRLSFSRIVALAKKWTSPIPLEMARARLLPSVRVIAGYLQLKSLRECAVRISYMTLWRLGAEITFTEALSPSSLVAATQSNFTESFSLFKEVIAKPEDLEANKSGLMVLLQSLVPHLETMIDRFQIAAPIVAKYQRSVHQMGSFFLAHPIPKEDVATDFFLKISPSDWKLSKHLFEVLNALSPLKTPIRHAIESFYYHWSRLKKEDDAALDQILYAFYTSFGNPELVSLPLPTTEKKVLSDYKNIEQLLELDTLPSIKNHIEMINCYARLGQMDTARSITEKLREFILIDDGPKKVLFPHAMVCLEVMAVATQKLDSPPAQDIIRKEVKKYLKAIFDTIQSHPAKEFDLRTEIEKCKKFLKIIDITLLIDPQSSLDAIFIDTMNILKMIMLEGADKACVLELVEIVCNLYETSPILTGNPLIALAALPAFVFQIPTVFSDLKILKELLKKIEPRNDVLLKLAHAIVAVSKVEPHILSTQAKRLTNAIVDKTELNAFIAHVNAEQAKNAQKS